MKIQAINNDHPMWEKTITLAENCSWEAGQRLAARMRNEDFSDWERVFAAEDDGSVIGFCVFEEKGYIPESFDCSPFINFVFVDERFRGQRISGMMIGSIFSVSTRAGSGQTGKRIIPRRFPLTRQPGSCGNCSRKKGTIGQVRDLLPMKVKNIRFRMFTLQFA